MEGGKSVAHDMVTKQKIACFPPEIHDPDLLSKLKGRELHMHRGDLIDIHTPPRQD